MIRWIQESVCNDSISCTNIQSNTSNKTIKKIWILKKETATFSRVFVRQWHQQQKQHTMLTYTSQLIDMISNILYKVCHVIDRDRRVSTYQVKGWWEGNQTSGWDDGDV